MKYPSIPFRFLLDFKGDALQSPLGGTSHRGTDPSPLPLALHKHITNSPGIGRGPRRHRGAAGGREALAAYISHAQHMWLKITILHKHSILRKDKSGILVHVSCLCEGVLCVWSASCKGVSPPAVPARSAPIPLDVPSNSLRITMRFSYISLQFLWCCSSNSLRITREFH